MAPSQDIFACGHSAELTYLPQVCFIQTCRARACFVKACRARAWFGKVYRAQASLAKACRGFRANMFC
ncbi:unnamed protein product [Arabis nemorensis]|uniref:Uncharacterized protein n=1 Tax=Arabis nemorensis TaxID=586526 RepID=A0A565C5C2_9BRAS|nr:unnamed protein product [Arabis nemorensis]